MSATLRRVSSGVLFAAALLNCATAAADTDAQRIEERLPAETKPPADAPAAQGPDLEANYATFAAFDLKSMTVDGMTAVSEVDAQACVKPFLGKTMGPIELTSLAQCITRLYRDRGLFLSRAIVPPQEVTDGVVKIRVIEGYIIAIAAKGLDQADADAQFAASLDERPANLSTFERALLLLADRYGHRVKGSQLVPDANDPARYTLNLVVEVTPVAWRLYGDNRGTEEHGPEQAFAMAAWNALFGAPDRLAVSLFTSPTDTRELLYADANYAHGWAEGDFWTELGASISRSNDGSVPAMVASSNDVDRIYGRITLPVLRSRAQSFWVALGADARDTQANALPASRIDESTRVLRGSLSYTLVKGAVRTDLALEGSHGFDALGASSNGDPALTRSDGRPEFTKVRLDASLLYKFSDKWQLAVMAAGQLADGALVSSEEFGGGGARFGRGYDYSEIIGDDGLAGAIELRWNWKNPWAFFTNLQLYAFADSVRTWNSGFAPSGAPVADLRSAGLGIRLSVRPGITASIEGAKPINRDVAAEGDRSPRVFVSLSMGW